MELKLEVGEIQVRLAHHEMIDWPCPEGGTACKLCGHQPERQWRHLDTCQYQTMLHAEPPRSECGNHGVRVVKMPWAEPSSRFTALFYLYGRQYDQALEQFRKALELDPNYGLAYWYRGLAYEQKSMDADAIRKMSKGRELLPGNTVIYSDIGHAYAIAGNRAAAASILAELGQLRARAYVSPFEIALIYIGLGQKDQAFESLERAYRERSDMLIYLRVDPRLDPLRSDPRFTALVHRIGIPQ